VSDYGSFNKTLIVGRITGDIKSKDSKKGTPVATFSVATNELYLNENKPRPSFHRVVTFGKKAEMMVEYGEKGRLVCIEGKLHTRSWKDENEQTHTVVEVAAEQIIFLEASKKKEEKTQEKDPDSVEKESGAFEETGRQPGEDDPFD
jgi:single-strand DNA-binding protein